MEAYPNSTRMKLYIDKGNERQILRNLRSDGYPAVRFERRRDHLGRRYRSSVS